MWVLGGAFILLCALNGKLFAQEEDKVIGTVRDLDGNLINGTVYCSASVSVVANGAFTIKPAYYPDTIRVVALGFASVTRIVHGPGKVHIRMTPSINRLEEVVVNTGYQTVNPNEINGSVSLITADMITAKATGNILERIQGHASGLTTLVGKQETSQGGTGVLVRGLGTFHGPMEPLIVLDGFIYDGNINNIDPHTVENVTILKDAAASSIWGARAGNGVIVITTKKGKFNQLMRISVQADRTVQAPPELPDAYFVGADTHIEMEKFLFEQGFFDQRIRNTPYMGLSPIVDLLSRHRDGMISQADLDREMTFWSRQDARQNYLDEFYTTATTHNLGVQINGGSERNSYMMGASYHNRTSNLYDKENRLTIRMNNQFRIRNNLTLSANVQLNQNRFQSGRNGYGSFMPGGRGGDYLAFRDELGNPLPLDFNYSGYYTDSIGKDVLLDWKYYPTEEYKHRESHNNRLNLFSTLNLNYQMLSWLGITGSFQYQIQDSKQVVHTNEESYVSRDLINQYTQVNPNTGVVSHVVPIGGLYNSSEASVNSFAWRGQANLNKQLGVHRLTGILGMELRGSGTSSKAHAPLHGYQRDPLSYAYVDVENRYPHFITGAMSRIGTGSSALTLTNYRFVSYYGNFAYTFLNRYTLTGSARRDGSNLFGVNTNDRWKPLWSAGMGWNISNELFYEARYISDLKAVITYGRSGNVDMSKTALPIANIGTHRETGFRTAAISVINNPELRWEQLDQLSVRLDGASSNGRVHGTLAFFKKYGSDLFGDAPYDITGWGLRERIVRNVASMEGHGIELDLHATYIKSNKFKWEGTWYLNRNKNKTTDYYPLYSIPTLSQMLVSGDRINPVIGQPLYAIAAFRWGGLDAQGNPIGYIDGAPSTDYSNIINNSGFTDDNIVFKGSALPTYYGSLINNWSYGPVQFSVNIGFNLGYFVKKNHFSSRSAVNGSIHKDYLIRWQSPGDELITNVPSFVYPVLSDRDTFYGFSESHIIPGDHIRLNYINLIYNVNTTQWRYPFRNFDLRFGLENGPVLWTKNKERLDPSYLDGGRNRAIWSLGVNVQL